MREIKFRGKRVDNGEWVFGYYVYDERTEEHKIFTSEYSERLKLRSLHCHIVHPSSVDQFTGLRDKNGKEIYEGDVVTSLYTFGESECLRKPSEVVWNDEECAFQLYGYFGQAMDNYELEIIGNIHENPKLLK